MSTRPPPFIVGFFQTLYASAMGSPLWHTALAVALGLLFSVLFVVIKQVALAVNTQKAADDPAEDYFYAGPGCVWGARSAVLCTRLRGRCALPVGRHLQRMRTVHLTPSTHPPAFRSKKGDRVPSVHDAPTVLVSVVVPAYNESKRIAVMMDEMLGFLRATEKANRCVS